MSQHSPIGDLSQQVLTDGSLRELASGVDSLYLSGWTDLPGRLLERLEVAKGRAQTAEKTVPVRFGGIEFGIAPHGWQMYRYRLAHEYGILGITPSPKLPPIRFQPKAEFLHGLGVESAVDAIRHLVASEVGEHRLSVSRADLFADWQGWSPSFAEEDRFVTRARHLTAEKYLGEWTGFVFGRRGSGGIGGKIYDKTAEISKKGAVWWFDKWKERYVSDQPVIRIEFEFHRTAIAKQFGLDTPEEVLTNLGGLWAYATDSWLTHRVPTGDATRSRWPLSEPWQSIQHPSFRGDSVGLERTTSSKKAATLDNILPVLRGCFTSASAVWGADSLPAAIECFTADLLAWERNSGIGIPDRIREKRRKQEWGP